MTNRAIDKTRIIFLGDSSSPPHGCLVVVVVEELCGWCRDKKGIHVMLLIPTVLCRDCGGGVATDDTGHGTWTSRVVATRLVRNVCMNTYILSSDGAYIHIHTYDTPTYRII